MAEGHTKDEKQLYGPADRKLKLKSGFVIRKRDIPTFFDDDLLKDIETFSNWRLIGFPRANWSECSNRMVQTVLTLKPYYDFYKGGR